MHDPAAPFRWRDGERTIAFGRGVLAEAVGTVGGPGYALLTTPRAERCSPELVALAGSVHHVPPGQVGELAGDLLDHVESDRIVALGGGRIIDCAKALAAANRLGHGGGAIDARAMAIPTTLSGAEMTAHHRHARGIEPMAPHVRCAAVLFDPELAASQPLPELAASALNALGHAVEAPCTPRANPVATLAARRAAALIGAAFADPDEPDRDALALAALLAGYTIDSAWYGLHHVLSQTLRSHTGVEHATANAVMLPHSLPALGRRFAREHEQLTAALGGEPAEVAARIRALTGTTRLREVGVDEAAIARCAAAATERAELAMTPPPADEAELLAIYGEAL